MLIKHEWINLETEPGVNIYNLTPQLASLLAATGITNGQVLVFSRHTTTALAINEYETRLLDDLKIYLHRLVPPSDRYLHNDLHLRDVPADEPMNAHAHIAALMLSSSQVSQVIPVIDGKLALGTWQSVLFFDLDGPRPRTVLVQISGQ
jgi:secondary thiamine-phosphate synthase enzyme